MIGGRDLERDPVLCHFADPMSHAHTPPQLPEVTDEAGDSPRWLPLLGVALFVLMVAYVWWSHRQSEAAEADGAPSAAQQDP